MREGVISLQFGCVVQSNNQNYMMITSLSALLKRIWQIETIKYKRKGLKNVLIGFFILYLYFWHVPNIARSLWPQHVENKMLFQFTAITIVFSAALFLYSLIYLPGYLGVEAYKKYEIQPFQKKPWEKEGWKTLKKRTIWMLIMNYCVVIPFYVGTGLIITGVRMRFQGFPTHWEILKTFILVLMVDDSMHMCFHRLFHEIPALYRFHKVHHEYDSVFCMVGQYAHPIQEIFGNLLPGTIVFGLLDVHIFTFFFWQMYKLYNSTQGHSRYQFPWSPSRVLPFIYDPSYHDFHHYKNKGNYATSFYLCELIFGTNKAFFDEELAKAGIKSD